MTVATTPQVQAATRLPGVGPRAAATVVDGIVGGLAFGVPLVLLFGKTSTTTNADGSTTTTHSTSDPKVFALWGVLAIAYYVVFEAVWAATPGKFVLGLRVRDRSGQRIGWKASLIRNALRVVDAFPYFIPYLVGAIAVWSDGSSELDWVPDEQRRRRRLGDRAAGTIVTYR